jgi:hypothetical protein
MKLLLRLYPAAWRERYGEEFLEIVARERGTPLLALDVLAGAFDAHLNSRLGARAAKPAAGATGGLAMVGGLSFRCADADRQTRAEMLRSSLLLAGLILAMTALFVVLRRTYGSTLWVEALGFAAMPLSLALWSAQGVLRYRTWTVRGLLVLLVAAVSLLGAWLTRSF